MRHVLVLITFGILFASPGLATESNLLETVKSNSKQAKALCRKFRKMNKDGRSAYSPKTTKRVATKRQLTLTDAEVLVTYVVGMHCPEVR